MKIYFSHGKESGPWGSKITHLALIARQKHGCATESINYKRIDNPDARLEKLLEVLDREKGPYCLVGSSMGGYVSLCASEKMKLKPEGVFLMAPALYMPGYQQQSYTDQRVSPIEIIHAWDDGIVPAENSLRYARQTESKLHLVHGGHRLDAELETIGAIFNEFLKTILK